MARRTGISAWYDYKISNARVEGINNKIKIIKRKAYGFRDEKYFELILLGLYDETNAIMRWTTKHIAGEYINSKAGKKRIKKEWKYREKKDELHTFNVSSI